MDTSTVKAVYRPCRPRESPLWRLFDRHFHRFKELYEQRFAERYGPLRPVVPRVVEDFLKCGMPPHAGSFGRKESLSSGLDKAIGRHYNPPRDELRSCVACPYEERKKKVWLRRIYTCL